MAASSRMVFDLAKRLADRDGKDWSGLSLTERTIYSHSAYLMVAESTTSTIKFPKWVAAPSLCTTSTTSRVFSRGSIFGSQHGAVKYYARQKAQNFFVRRSTVSGLMYASVTPPIGFDHKSGCKCTDCEMGY